MTAPSSWREKVARIIDPWFLTKYRTDVGKKARDDAHAVALAKADLIAAIPDLSPLQMALEALKVSDEAVRLLLIYMGNPDNEIAAYVKSGDITFARNSRRRAAEAYAALQGGEGP